MYTECTKACMQMDRFCQSGCLLPPLARHVQDGQEHLDNLVQSESIFAMLTIVH